MSTTMPFKYYKVLTDEYILPDGRVVDASAVKEIRRGMLDQMDESFGYDPYDHLGKSL